MPTGRRIVLQHKPRAGKSPEGAVAGIPGMEAGCDLLRGASLHIRGWRPAAGQAVECPSGAAAIRRAQAMSSNEINAGAVAFSRSGDPNLGEFEDAVILKAFGLVPEDFGQG
jgi:hypothetical protein